VKGEERRIQKTELRIHRIQNPERALPVVMGRPGGPVELEGVRSVGALWSKHRAKVR
jgi:hypothetical protein